MRIKILIFFFAAACLFFAACNEGNSNVTVEAGDQAFDETPYSFEWTGDALAEDADICLVSGEERIPGQVERARDGRTLIWFLATVPAGESRDYEIRIGESCGESRFALAETENHATDILYGETPVLQYVHPVFDPDDAENTMKPFHQVYAPDGNRLITKGLGGLYPHHRGIYFGYNRIRFEGGSADIWHAREGEYSEHRETVQVWAGPVFGGHSVRIDWIDPEGTHFIEEIRTIRAFKQSDGEFFIDFESELISLAGDIELGGDNHHAGVQFRASQYVADNSEPSRFLRPGDWADLASDEEHAGITALPWNAFQFVVEDDGYTVAYMTHPGNAGLAPDDDREMSERLYGRFGEFIPTTLPADEPIHFRYRFWITDRRDDITRDEIDAHYQAYSGGH